MTEHTPGPWKVWKYGNLVMADALAPYDWTVAEAMGETHEATKANAHLIAAAPDMLEYMETHSPKCEHCIGNPMVTYHSDACLVRDEIIAKARGAS